MKKHVESVPQPQVRLQEHTFSRTQRTWQHVAMRASHDITPSNFGHSSKSTGASHWRDANCWIHRQRLN